MSLDLQSVPGAAVSGPEAIRDRVDAALRMVELAHVVADAEVVRCSLALALADMAAAGLDLAIATGEYTQAVAAVEYARDAQQRARDDLATVRCVTPLSA